MMDDFDSEDKFSEVAVSYSKPMDFEEGFRLARLLVAKGDIKGCLETLAHLEERYVKAAQIFDLYGEVLIRQGNVSDGIRYKTVHTVLDGIFKNVTGVAPAFRQFGEVEKPVTRQVAPESKERVWDSAPSEEQDWQGREADLFPQTALPVTVAMGSEFMRQGHFDRALDIFDQLVEIRPQDESIKELRARAAKKNREKRMLAILQRWLKNIEQMKSGD